MDVKAKILLAVLHFAGFNSIEKEKYNVQELTNLK